MSAAFQKLRSKLSELFQLDAAAELDFGIYRILNARRVEISEFLDSLDGQVDAILAEALGSGSGDTKAELEKTIADLRALSVDESAIDANKKVMALREKLAAAGSDPTALSHEIFSHLATFFSRYYKDGDFISLRRYKKDTYAIPYEGEEVKLHWANADQYYIKSSETLRDYDFRLGPAPKGDKPDTRPTVSFKLVEADIEKDNTKAVAGQERRFIFQGAVESDSKEHLILGFAYLALSKAEKQTSLSDSAAKAILADYAKGAFTDLAAKDPTYTGSQKGGRTILAKHLAEYTGRNTFDYFVHKDLGGFLRRELDFYVKNEVLHLDDLDEAPEANWNETRAKLKALRSIAAKVIHFLAQLENFQKKLWLKKKFVTSCDYVVTLDRIPEDLYPEIAACDAQREEWVKLFAIDEVKGDLGRSGYSVPLTVAFLNENQGLVVDTRLVNQNVRLSICEILRRKPEHSAQNLLLWADNFHGVKHLKNWGAGRISCIYIDPPYNTDASPILYKNGYKKSSWQSLMADRLIAAKPLLSELGTLAVAIDDEQQKELGFLIRDIFQGVELGTIIVRANPSGRPMQTGYSISHEYVIFAGASSKATIARMPPTVEQMARFNQKDDMGNFEWRNLRREGSNSDRSARPFLYYPIFINGDTIRVPAMEWDRSEHAWTVLDKPKPTEDVVWPTNENGEEKTWRWGHETVMESLTTLSVRPDRSGRNYVYYKRRPNEAGVVCISSWMDARYSATEHGSALLKRLFNKNPFDYPKSIHAVTDSIFVGGAWMPNATVLDFFAGSGTTGHAVINLNRKDGGDRKYILIEMGQHFDTVLVPRLKKVIYSSDWKDGKPQSRDTGISHCFKILRLESYEDTLNNLRLSRSRAQELALEEMSPEAREQYQLGYMLDLETRGSQSLLNVSAFTDPWNYTLEIASGTAGETKTTKVDLVETFNWLLGLTVLAQGHGGGVQWVEGTNPEGDKVLVLWRNTTEVDADALNDWCKKQKVSVLDGEFGLIYINGDHHLENLRREDQTWKVRLTDEEFPKLMWDGCE
jgi:adenine-specific DNA-methyltransferase